MKIEFSQHIFAKYSGTKFHENTSSGNRGVAYRQRDIKKLVVSLHSFCEFALKIVAY